jgi:oligoendopeptidase F
MQVMATAFVPADLDATRWDQIEPLLRALLDRPVRTPAEFEQWLADRSELDAACAEARATLYITMSCNTDDDAANAAYTRYLETIPPRLKPVAFELDRKHVSLTEAIPLGDRRYGVLNRSVRASVGLYRDVNVPIQTDLAKLAQEFDKIAGAQTVMFDGSEMTLPQMSRFLESPDRARRDAAWHAIAQRRLKDRDALNSVYDRMIPLRDRMAKNAGFQDYIGYAFVEKKRFDYTPASCAAFWSAVEKHVVPLVRRLDRERRAALGLETLRPWDLSVDTKGRPALRPFEGGRDLFNKTVRVFEELDARLAVMIRSLDAPPGGAAPRNGAVRSDCLDLDTRKGKRPGGYQYVRDRRRLPFIFMNAAGVQRDVMTMIHEAGHAFHSLLCAGDPLVEYRHSPIEFAEVASMSMEHLTMPYWGAAGFYTTAEDLARARRTHLEDSITILAWIAIIDAFQHWIYSHPDHTPEQRDAQWLALDDRFGRAVSWEGLDDFRAAAWQKQSHLFTHPMYYIEYGIAQLGALQLWLKSGEEGEPAAVNAYIRALTLGGSRPLPDLFATAGLEFDFGDATIARIVEAVEGELERIGD